MLQTANQPAAKISRAALLGIVVSALGFFVDLYDMMIFIGVRDDSFTAIGLAKADFKSYGQSVINMQMFGMLLGGFLWGAIGDKFGRLKVLFGSILVYSLFTLLNAFVTNIEQYKWCRFLAGIGLAGELGAGITLVTEQMDKRYRGFAVALVGSIGMMGAVTAGLVGNTLSWKTAYIIGSVLGFALLLLRLGVLESGLFNAMKTQVANRGNFLLILKRKKLLWKFICILLVGLPGWYATGILIGLTKEIATSMGMDPLPLASKVLMYNFMGFAAGDIICGLLSQRLKSRKKAIYIFLTLYTIFVACFFLFAKNSVTLYYALFVGMGISVGFSIMLFTLAAEQFGTNIRTLVTSTTLNLVRAWVIPLNLAFNFIGSMMGNNNYYAAIVLGIVCLTLAFLALSQLDETFHKDLDYYEN
jgi:MFS transporter, putative metabolite:H+ symporter